MTAEKGRQPALGTRGARERASRGKRRPSRARGRRKSPKNGRRRRGRRAGARPGQDCDSYAREERTRLARTARVGSAPLKSRVCAPRTGQNKTDLVPSTRRPIRGSAIPRVSGRERTRVQVGEWGRAGEGETERAQTRPTVFHLFVRAGSPVAPARTRDHTWQGRGQRAECPSRSSAGSAPPRTTSSSARSRATSRFSRPSPYMPSRHSTGLVTVGFTGWRMRSGNAGARRRRVEVQSSSATRLADATRYARAPLLPPAYDSRADALVQPAVLYGPLQAARRAVVPLWLAVHLKKKRKCHIDPPTWLTIRASFNLARPGSGNH